MVCKYLFVEELNRNSIQKSLTNFTSISHLKMSKNNCLNLEFFHPRIFLCEWWSERYFVIQLLTFTDVEIYIFGSVEADFETKNYKNYGTPFFCYSASLLVFANNYGSRRVYLTYFLSS